MICYFIWGDIPTFLPVPLVLVQIKLSSHSQSFSSFHYYLITFELYFLNNKAEGRLMSPHSSDLTTVCHFLCLLSNMSGMTFSTANYLWSVQDVLGQGATASVYKARNKVANNTEWHHFNSLCSRLSLSSSHKSLLSDILAGVSRPIYWATVQVVLRKMSHFTFNRIIHLAFD